MLSICSDVFSVAQIEADAELKWEEPLRLEVAPAPVEPDMYYSSQRAAWRKLGGPFV